MFSAIPQFFTEIDINHGFPVLSQQSRGTSKLQHASIDRIIIIIIIECFC